MSSVIISYTYVLGNCYLLGKDSITIYMYMTKYTERQKKCTDFWIPQKYRVEPDTF